MSARAILPPDARPGSSATNPDSIPARLLSDLDGCVSIPRSELAALVYAIGQLVRRLDQRAPAPRGVIDTTILASGRIALVQGQALLRMTERRE